MKILLVEDDVILNDTIANYLEWKGYHVTPVCDGTTAIVRIDEGGFDAYIIDINIPGHTGLEVVSHIRKKNDKAPIIMITASMEVENFKSAYRNGCSDYIKKPFYLEELEIRLAKLIPLPQKDASILHITDGIAYDLDYEELKIDGVAKRLRRKEKRLLLLFLKNINKTLPVAMIEDYVWEGEIKDSYPLRQLVNDLRRHFDGEQKFIFADRGIGYRFEVKSQT